MTFNLTRRNVDFMLIVAWGNFFNLKWIWLEWIIKNINLNPMTKLLEDFSVVNLLAKSASAELSTTNFIISTFTRDQPSLDINYDLLCVNKNVSRAAENWKRNAPGSRMVVKCAFEACWPQPVIQYPNSSCLFHNTNFQNKQFLVSHFSRSFRGEIWNNKKR